MGENLKVAKAGSGWVSTTLGLLLALVVLASVSLSGGGLSAFAVNAGVAGSLTGFWVFVSGRRSWLRLPSRMAGLTVLVISLFITGCGAAGFSGGLMIVGILLALTGLLAFAVAGGDGAVKAMGVTFLIVAGIVTIIAMVIAPSGQRSPAASVRAVWDGTTGRVAFFSAAEPTAVSIAEPEAEAATGSPSPGRTPAVASHVEATAAPYNPLATARFDSALEQLDRIPVKARDTKVDYDRGYFGAGWFDPDGNFCGTRDDILRRDLTDIIIEPNTRECGVKSGTLDDPYTAKVIAYKRKASDLNGSLPWEGTTVQIDHVVALADAWDKGAQLLPRPERIAFANDPLNLLAVDTAASLVKGSSDAASWLPPNTAFWCEYVSIQTAVKAKYGLWMTQAESDRIREILTLDCAGQPVPEAGQTQNHQDAEPEPTPEPVVEPPYVAPAPEPAPEPVPEQPYIAPEPYVDPEPYVPPVDTYIPPAPVPAPPAAVYYANCTAVKAAGAAPIYPWSPGWQPKFDRNNDGVGCE